MSHSAQLETLDETPRSNGCKRPCRVLVVEDHVDSATMLATFLSFEGYLVRAAYNADITLEIAREFQPEVCLATLGYPSSERLLIMSASLPIACPWHFLDHGEWKTRRWRLARHSALPRDDHDASRRSSG